MTKDFYDTIKKLYLSVESTISVRSRVKSLKLQEHYEMRTTFSLQIIQLLSIIFSLPNEAKLYANLEHSTES